MAAVSVNNSASEPTAAQIRAHRDQILASQIFSRSGRQSAFLDYIINAHLEGRADQLKEFTLAIDVFGRDETFDPGIESIVRVEASRLRAKLREYYASEGQGDAVQIDIPKGRYIPHFRLTDESGEVHKPARPWIPAAAAGIIALVFATAYLSNRAPNRQADRTANIPDLPLPSSIAVLPLRDFSDRQEVHFAEAMTDALISALAGIRALRVTSLTSVLRYRSTETPIPEIGRALDVAYIVEGSIVRDAGNVRITAQLIAAESDEHIWSNTFDRPAPDLLAMQSEVATAIAAQISDELLPLSGSRIGPLNQAAYEAYLKGRYFHNKFTSEGFDRSMSYFREAIDIEPDYAEAYAGLASCHCLLAGHGLEMVSPVIAIPEAQTLAMKALSLNSELAEPTAFLGIINLKFSWDAAGAETMLARAIELNPSLYQAHVWQSQVLEATGRHEEAVNRARYAKQLNPLSLAAGLNLGWQLFQAGMYIEASTQIDELIEFNPDFWGGHWAKGHIYNEHQTYEKAIGEFQRAIDLEGGHSLPMAALGYTYAVAGMPDEARRVIADLEALAKDIYVSPFHVATVYAGLKETDRMFEWLEHAYSVRARSLAWLQVTREMQPYYKDERFQDLLTRIGIVRVRPSNTLQ